MARNGFKVMDSDMHIVEPADLWQKYMEPGYRDRAPVGLNRHFRDLGVEVEGRVFPTPNRSYSNAITPIMEQQTALYHESQELDWNSDSQVMAMDNEGIDVAILFPSRGLFTLGIDGMDPGLAAAISRAYNTWLSDFCRQNPARLHGAAMIPPHDVDEAVKEARRAVKDWDSEPYSCVPTWSMGETGTTRTTIRYGRSYNG